MPASLHHVICHVIVFFFFLMIIDILVFLCSAAPRISFPQLGLRSLLTDTDASPRSSGGAGGEDEGGQDIVRRNGEKRRRVVRGNPGARTTWFPFSRPTVPPALPVVVVVVKVVSSPKTKAKG